ncbi:MAG: SRPBCC domain-containing protein [Myxococcota bacterium]
MAENISLSDIIPAPPARVFSAWLDPHEHGRMTGSTATDEGEGRFTAWDGYISGRTVASEPHSRIEQAWRTTEFPEGAPDSELVVRFEPEGEGTRVTIEHSGIPDGQADGYSTAGRSTTSTR